NYSSGRAQMDDVAGRDAADLAPGELHQQMAFAGDLDGPSREHLAGQLHPHVPAQSRRRPPVVQQRASPAPGLDESAVVLLEAVEEPGQKGLAVDGAAGYLAGSHGDVLEPGRGPVPVDVEAP